MVSGCPGSTAMSNTRPPMLLGPAKLQAPPSKAPCAAVRMSIAAAWFQALANAPAGMPCRYTRWLKNHSSGSVGPLDAPPAGACSFARRIERSELEHDAAATAANTESTAAQRRMRTPLEDPP